MTSKEILQTALRHEQGQIPIDLGTTGVTGIHVLAIKKLREYYGLEDRPITLLCPYSMLGQIDDDLAEILGLDVRALLDKRSINGLRLRDYKPWRSPWGIDLLVPGEFNTTEDKDGNLYLYAQGDTAYPPSCKMPKNGYYFDAIERQKEDVDLDDLKLEDNTEEFGPIDDVSLNQLATDAAALKDSGYGVLGCFGGAGLGDIALVPQVGMKDPKGVRSVADWYTLLAYDPDFVKKIFAVQVEYAIENLRHIHEVVGDVPDVLYTCGTDFGSQNGPLFSLEAFRDIFKPFYIQVNKWIHENTNWKIFKHSCGSIMPFIDEFIECGFDVLNPVQWSAKNMDKRELKKRFGDKLVFWGGTVNAQQTLPFGTPEQVYAEAMDSCRVFGENGGFVFNNVHCIQANTPPENIDALFRAVRDYNRG